MPFISLKELSVKLRDHRLSACENFAHKVFSDPTHPVHTLISQSADLIIPHDLLFVSDRLALLFTKIHCSLFSLHLDKLESCFSQYSDQFILNGSIFYKVLIVAIFFYLCFKLKFDACIRKSLWNERQENNAVR